MKLPTEWKDRAAMVAFLLGCLALAQWAMGRGVWVRDRLVGDAIRDSIRVHVRNYHEPTHRGGW